ncbi:hypothetical protein LCGC14_3078080 [marine sediment metagenome]|uniref:Uncharacterized protein n=1 Tax=marine sediment metagenome TaxID=412755 RepID=A0A0F8Z4T4_9ZZZZ
MKPKNLTNGLFCVVRSATPALPFLMGATVNGIFLTNWIDSETEGYCFERKLAFIDEVLADINEYRIEFKVNKVSPDPSTDTEKQTQ